MTLVANKAILLFAFCFQVLNIFIIIKITKSARFRKQFRRHDDDEDQDGEDTDQEDLLRQRNKQTNLQGKEKC